MLVFPPDDVPLRHEVDRALAEILPTVPEPRQMAALTDRLRTWYRSVQVRQRDALAGYDDDPTSVWYVYRDGRVRARNERLERLYGAMAAARDTIRLSERALDDSRSAAGRAGYGTDEDEARALAADRDPTRG